MENKPPRLRAHEDYLAPHRVAPGVSPGWSGPGQQLASARAVSPGGVGKKTAKCTLLLSGLVTLPRRHFYTASRTSLEMTPGSKTLPEARVRIGSVIEETKSLLTAESSKENKPSGAS